MDRIGRRLHNGHWIINMGLFDYSQPPTAELISYAEALYARRDTGQVVTPFEVEIDGQKPLRNRCHDNADWWVEHHPEYAVVRGWLYSPLSGLPWSRFVSHSVVRDATGQLRDITPLQALQTYSFLAAEVPEQTYKTYECALFDAHGRSNLDHYHDGK